MLLNETPELKNKPGDWKYYNHALIPTTEPHEQPDTTPILDGSIWKMVDGKPLLARWTTDFDCGYETQWWYCIKDTPLDVTALHRKKRYEITKGTKNFDVRVIDPKEYDEQLYAITIAAYSGWSKSHRPNVDKNAFLNAFLKASVVVLGAFYRETDELCGYVLLTEGTSYVNFNVMRTQPSCEKLGINAALVAGICQHYAQRLSAGEGFYICDGARNVLHKTAFQDYLEKGFDFRKAYCRLHILYRKPVGLLVGILMPFRKILYKLDHVGVISKINGILRMEVICRSQTAEK